MKADVIAEEIETLRETIRANDGANIARGPFARKVDQLIRDFYDDIGELTALRLSDILDLFLIKVLYVDRGSRDAATLEYLGELLGRYLQTGTMSLPGGGFVPYLGDLLSYEAEGRPRHRAFETYRQYGDNAIFISGLFPESLGRKRTGGRMGGAPLVDQRYFATVGRMSYERAAGEDLAERMSLRTTLLRLSRWFDLYVEALNDMSGRYVMGIDMRLITDKMLDAFNLYRQTHETEHLTTARTYAALLKLDGRQWPALDEMALDLSF